MNDNDIVARFFDSTIYIRRCSYNTAKTYSVYAQLFLTYLEDNNIKLNDVKLKHVINFFKERKYQNTLTLHTAITSLISFGDYLYSMHLWDYNVIKQLDRPRCVNTFRTKYMSVEQIDCFLGSIDPDTLCGIRDAALFELIYSSGLRCSEACNLEMKNLNLFSCWVKVIGKGSIERQVPFGSVAKDKLTRYLQIARPLILMGKSCRYVFVGLNTRNKMDRKNVWFRFQLYMDKAGLKEDGICVHTLRHCFATHLLDGGADIETVRILLGHSLLTTTAIYTHISSKKLAECHSIYFRM